MSEYGALTNKKKSIAYGNCTGDSRYRIAIIIGSTRPGRKVEAVAKWVYEISQTRSDAEFELVDIKTSTCRFSKDFYWAVDRRRRWGLRRPVNPRETKPVARAVEVST